MGGLYYIEHALTVRYDFVHIFSVLGPFRVPITDRCGQIYQQMCGGSSPQAVRRRTFKQLGVLGLKDQL